MPLLEMNQILAEANVFVKEIDTGVSAKEFRKFFSTYGKLLSIQLKTNAQGESLGYGYAQYATKEEALHCIAKANDVLFMDKKIQVELFKPKGRRTFSKESTNLYLKDLPEGIELPEL